MILVSRPRNTSPFALEVGWCNNAGESEDVPPGTRPREVVEYLRLASRSTTNLWDGTLGACAVGNRETSERMRLASSVAVLWREGVPPSIAPARARILVVQRMFCAPCGAVEGGTPSLRELANAR